MQIVKPCICVQPGYEVAGHVELGCSADRLLESECVRFALSHACGCGSAQWPLRLQLSEAGCVVSSV